MRRRISAEVVSVVALALSVSCAPPRRQMITSAPPPATAPDRSGEAKLLSRADLLSDLRELRSILEDTHPDPYLHAGGKVAFRRRFADAEAAVPPEGMTSKGFFRVIRPLAAQIGDAHTLLAFPAERDDAQVWVDLAIVEERLVVRSVYSPVQRSLLGAVVTAVEGVPIATLVERMGARRGHDNEYGNLDNVARSLRSAVRLADLLDRESVSGAVRFDVTLPDRSVSSLVASVGPREPGPRIVPETALRIPDVDAAEMASGFLDDADRTAFFRIDSSMKYREAFEAWSSVGFRESLGDHLDAVVRLASGRPAEGEVAHRIAFVPSVVERLETLFSEMKARKTRTLIVDVRENEGGNGLFATILAYFLYPLDAIVEANARSGYQVPRYSALYFANRDADSPEKVRERTSSSFAVGDLDFTEERRWRAATASPLPSEARAAARAELDELVQLSSTFSRAVTENRWNATWTPRVLVITSAATMSAGFDAVLTLRAHGASVVGVPPGQAANCFIDALPFELTHSHLGGQVSFKYSVQLPGDEKRGSLLLPDQELTYERYAKMGFDPNASVRLATGEKASGD